MWRRKAASMSNCPTTPVIGSLTYWKKKNILLEAGTGRDGPEQFTNAIKLQQELRGEQTVWARPRKGSMAKRVLTGSDIEALPPGGELVVPPDSIVTDRAREIAAERGVAIRTEGSPAGPSAGQRVQPAPARVVAIGADHGGFELKETLKRYLTEWGYTVTDFGTDSAKAVDYPDFALAVAQAVARGDACAASWWTQLGWAPPWLPTRFGGFAPPHVLTGPLPAAAASTTMPMCSPSADDFSNRKKLARSYASGWTQRLPAGAIKAGWIKSRPLKSQNLEILNILSPRCEGAK